MRGRVGMRAHAPISEHESMMPDAVDTHRSSKRQFDVAPFASDHLIESGEFIVLASSTREQGERAVNAIATAQRSRS